MSEIKITQQQQNNMKNKNNNNYSEIKPNMNINNNKIKENKNLNLQTNTQNRSVSAPLIGTESQYGVITPEIKKCKPTDKTQLGKCDKLEITVTNPEKKETGFLKKVHVNYLISTFPINIKVRRRFSDIDWFRQALLNLYPLDLIPAIPKQVNLV